MAPKGSGVDLGGGSAHHRVLVDGSQQKNEHALFIHKRTSTLTSFVDGAKPRQVLGPVEIKILRLVCNSLVDFHTGLGSAAR